MRFKDFNIINESSEPDIIGALRDFLPIAVKELKLKRLPKIKFLSKLDNEDQPTFGRFSHDGKKAMIELNIINRHPVDVLRTLAHELVHYKQFVHKQLGQNSGDTGSSSENEAHVVAGIIMRHFDKLHPEYLSSKNISDEVTVSFNENKVSPYTAIATVERALEYLKEFSKTTTGFTLSFTPSHFNRRLNDKRNESTITGFDLKRTLKEFLKVWRNDLPALKVNTQFVIHDPSTSLWIPVFIGVENGAKDLILKTIMKGKHYDTQDEIVTITHDDVVSESKVTPNAKDLKLAKALEDYANKNISEREPGFGDFMYHAELIRKGHKDIHKQDLSTVQQKYRKIMTDMIKKHLNEAIAPHGSPENEFKMMQAGNKPAALVDPSYFKKLYKKTADENRWPYFQLSIPGQNYSNFVVGLPGQEKRIHRIAELVTDMNVNRQPGIMPGAAYHRELGTLLGYAESDIQEFLKKMNLDEEYRDADYAKGNVKMPKAKPGRTQHPLHGKLVGE